MSERRGQWRGVRCSGFRSQEAIEAKFTPAPAEKQTECSICFEPLTSLRVAALCSGGHRVCRHFMHRTCAQVCPKAGGCPLCRAGFDDVLVVPFLSSATEWYDFMDFDRNGRLDRQEVQDGIIASLPVDYELVAEVLPVLWANRGKSPWSFIGSHELLGPLGLLQELQGCLAQKQPAPSRQSVPEAIGPCPDILVDKHGWFKHWDEDNSGVLERSEVIRGLAKAFKSDVPSQLASRRYYIRGVVEEMWHVVDTDGNDRVSMEEFCRPWGLADLILQRFDPMEQERKLQREVQSLKRKSSRSVKRRSAPRVSRWECATDLFDDGRYDRPMLLCRPSLGFRSPHGAIGGRRVHAQWSFALQDLSSWSAPASSPLPSDDDLEVTSIASVETDPGDQPDRPDRDQPELPECNVWLTV